MAGETDLGFVVLMDEVWMESSRIHGRRKRLRVWVFDGY